MTEDPLAETGEPRGYDLRIRQLKERAVRMGEWALGMVHDGWRAYDQGDLAAAQTVLDRDTQLDRFDEDMEHATIAFLVLRQPAAVDLRTAAALLKITTHLDRVGRLGFDMARITAAGPAREPSELRSLLEQMDEIVESMVRQALDALNRDQVDQARQLFRRDDTVDRMYREANQLIMEGLEKDPLSARRLACDLLVVRHFERVADNACKVGEKTIYALTGQRRSEDLPRTRTDRTPWRARARTATCETGGFLRTPVAPFQRYESSVGSPSSGSSIQIRRFQPSSVKDWGFSRNTAPNRADPSTTRPLATDSIVPQPWKGNLSGRDLTACLTKTPKLAARTILPINGRTIGATRPSSSRRTALEKNEARTVPAESQEGDSVCGLWRVGF